VSGLLEARRDLLHDADVASLASLPARATRARRVKREGQAPLSSSSDDIPRGDGVAAGLQTRDERFLRRLSSVAAFAQVGDDRVEQVAPCLGDVEGP
jgi:hypothetical protein